MRFVFAGEPTIKGVKNQYFYRGELPSQGWVISDPEGNKTVVKTGPEPEPAKSFKLIAYTPGCQLVTLSVDDLASSDRQGQIKCTHLNTIQFRGKVNVSPLVGKTLQVEVLYGCDWARAFFGTSTAVTPFSLGKVDIAPNGSFTISLPDFPVDPLWSTVAKDASLIFYLVDRASGQRLGTMKPSSDTSPNGGPLKVGPSYPLVSFSVQSK